ncbi:MFS general substrate transporter [Anaeromyces robustus]|uniref:MFS general substrate transporter n=1 Tax=Anaeromyces robustus TaxID=1754192 RepID=A0A1Y1WY54_9FUNG|nr:MFS general substrate transporter [Anaeromyces robustus]|eukprot:ORX78509.1 MFS general substrate transporter [Anaeromyces robustus]
MPSYEIPINDDTEVFLPNDEVESVPIKEKVKKPFPKLQVFLALLCVLPEAFADSLLVPYIYNMVKDFGVAEKEEDIGFYVGLLGSAFYFSLCITNIFWGHLSDKYGRKPILLCNIIGTCIGTIVFGSSQTFAIALLGRFIAGSCSANGTVAKGMIGDVIDESQRTIGYSFYGVTWGLSGMIGPLIGGALANPALKYGIYNNDFWKKYNYLLPSVFVMVVGVISFIVAYHLLDEPKKENSYEILDEEFIHLNENNTNYRNDWDEGSSSATLGNLTVRIRDNDNASSIISDAISEKKELSLFQSVKLIFSKSSWIAIICYSMLSLATMLFFTVFPLWAATSISLGGLGFDEQSISYAAPIMGISKIIIQLLIYPPIAKHMTSTQGYRFGLIILIIFAIFTPNISKHVNQPNTLWTLLVIFLSLFSASDAFAYLSVIIMITESVTSEHLGFMHGFSGMCVSIMRMIGPTLAGSIWSFSINNSIGYPFNEHLIFIVICILCVIGFGVSFMGFRPRNI